MTTRRPADRRDHLALSLSNFLSKGWEVSILGLLAFIREHYLLPLYMVGILSTVFIVSQLGVSLFAGKLARIFRSRNVVLLSIALSAAAWLTLSLEAGQRSLYLAYALAGISSGLFEPIGNALVAKHSAPANRARMMGNFAAFGDMGRIALVATATALAGWMGVHRTCWVLLGSGIVAFIGASFLLPRSLPVSDAETEPELYSIGSFLRNRCFRLATAAGIADSFSSASLYIFIPFLLIAKGIPLADTLYFNVVFFAGYMSGRLALGRLADRFGLARVLVLSNIAMAGLILLLTVAAGSPVLLGILFVLGVFTRGTSPIIRAMVAESIPDTRAFHDAFSAYSFASRGSSAICRPIYGYLASWTGIAAVFYLSAAVSLLSVYPASRYAAPLRTSEVPLPAPPPR